MSDSALENVTQHNSVIIVRDIHTSDVQFKVIADQLEDMHAQGLKHLFLEADAKNVTEEDYKNLPGFKGMMIDKAFELGIKVHFFDDRSAERILKERYPNEDTFRRDFDPYYEYPTVMKYLYADLENHKEDISSLTLKSHKIFSTLGLNQDSVELNNLNKIPLQSADAFKAESDFKSIKNEQMATIFSRSQAMQHYFDEGIHENHGGNMQFRNIRMAENIDQVMTAHSGEKGLVIVGGRHLEFTNDLEEALRVMGHRVSDIEVYLDQQKNIETQFDPPDFQINEHNNVTAYADLSWKNNEKLGHDFNANQVKELDALKEKYTLEWNTLKHHEKTLTKEEQAKLRLLNLFMPEVEKIEKGHWDAGAKQYLVSTMYNSLQEQAEFNQKLPIQDISR